MILQWEFFTKTYYGFGSLLQQERWGAKKVWLKALAQTRFEMWSLPGFSKLKMLTLHFKTTGALLMRKLFLVKILVAASKKYDKT